MKEIKPEELQKNAFDMIGKEWMLVTAECNGKINTMTASWGGIGIMWNKPVAYIFIRPQRYTKEFIDGADRLSLSILDDKYRSELTYFGTVSGRDEDKIKKSGLGIAREKAVPYFADANTAFICRKMYKQQYSKECFIDKTVRENNYMDEDYHYMYIVEIEKTLIRE